MDVKIIKKKRDMVFYCKSQITLIPFLKNVIKWMFCMQKCLLIKSTQVHCTDLSFWRHANKLWWSEKTWAGHQKVACLNPISNINITPLNMGHAVKDCLCSKGTCRDIYHSLFAMLHSLFWNAMKINIAYHIYLICLQIYTHQNNLSRQFCILTPQSS